MAARIERIALNKLLRIKASAFVLSGLVIALAATVSALGDLPKLSLSQPLTVKWRYDSDQTLDLTPATDGTAVYLPMAGGIVIALNATDGQLRWKSETGGDMSASPAADTRAVYVSTAYGDIVDGQHHLHGALHALGKEAGVTLWMRTIQAPIHGALVVGEKALFGGSVDGRVYAFDKNTGLVIWINQFEAAFSSQPVLSGKLLYIGGEDGTLLALDQNTGNVVWKYRTHGPIRGPAAVANGTVYFGSGDGYVYAFSESRSDLSWRRRTGAGVQGVAAVDTRLLVASLDNFVYCFSLNNGKDLWRRQLPGRLSAQPVTASDGALFTPLSSDAAIVLGLRDGKRVNTLPLGAENSSGASPIIAANLVLITAPGGLLAFAHPAGKP
jgi:outer membrane protein assembly factor BamB